MLRENTESSVSGELLSEKLKLTRVSVWKHIKKLKALGYKIESCSSGYKLYEESDLLYPWEFEEREPFIHFYDNLDSTMTEAHKLVEQGCPDKTIVITEKQTKGRGRLNRSWISNAGGLYFTYIIKPEVPYNLSWRYNFATSLSVVKVLRELYKIDALIKWPNDILIPHKTISKDKNSWQNYFGSKKIAGILSDMQIKSELIEYLNIGIGINVNNDTPGELPDSCSIKKLIGKNVSRKKLLTAFLKTFEDYLSDIDNTKLIEQWKSYSIIKNAEVKVVTPVETIFGKALDIDNEGALILELKDGSKERIIYGDCFPVTNNE